MAKWRKWGPFGGGGELEDDDFFAGVLYDTIIAVLIRISPGFTTPLEVA